MPMAVGVMQFELHLPGARSLKDKRRVVKGLKDRLHRHHLVSVAEIEALDHHRIARLGIAMTANDARVIHATFDRITDKLRAIPDARLDSITRDMLHADQLPPELLEPGAEAALWSPSERRDENEERPA